MMDVKEDPELIKLAYHLYRHLPNIPALNQHPSSSKRNNKSISTGKQQRKQYLI
jgi:hypothetical protein